jgi:hypothetical protein
LEQIPKGLFCAFFCKAEKLGKESISIDQEGILMEMTERNFLAKNWEDFEAWIEEKVGGEISWKVKPMDTKVNRMIVAMSILDTLDRNDGEFPSSGNPFIEVIGEGRKSAPDTLRESSRR